MPRAMWTGASMPSRLSRVRIPAPTAAIFRAAVDVMPGKGEGRAKGLAEQSLNTSIVHPDQSGPDQPEQGDRAAGSRSLTENDQRKGLEKTAADAPRSDNSSKA